MRRRLPNVRLVKRQSTSTVEELATLFDLHCNTIRNWLATGLKPIDNRRPVLIHGSDLIAFLRRKASIRKRHCDSSELYCFKCREPRQPRINSVSIEPQSARVVRLVGICVTCGTRMFKAISPRLIASYAEIFVLQPTQPEHIWTGLA